MTKKREIFKTKDKSFLLLYLPRSKELKITKVGFNISVGWNEKLKNFIHRLAPLVSGKKNIFVIERIIEMVKRIIEKRIIFFIDNFEKVKIIIRPIKQKIVCFFIKSSNLSSILIDTLNIPKIPIIIKKTIGKKINRSKFFL